jgi:cell wall-associated NlpC family hydrolase
MPEHLSENAQKLYEHYSKYIISIAQSQDQKNAGAHYLWGANGGIPGQGNVPGHGGIKSNIEKFFPNVLKENQNGIDAIFFAAKTNVEEKMYICLGRCADPSVVAKPFGDILIPNPPPQTDKRWARSKDLLNKNESLLKTYKATVQPKQRRPLNIERLILKNTTQTTEEYGMSWGEYCWDKQHFDCIAFVRWSVSQVLDIDVRNTDIKDFANMVDIIPLGEAKPGDIAIKGDEHIGFVVQPGAYVHAEWELTGVVTNSYKEWTKFGRLNAKFWNKVKGARTPLTNVALAKAA